MKPPRLAFYAPLKAPDHTHPSGDRHMATLLVQALRLADFTVELASRFRSHDRAGDPTHQQRLRSLGQRLAARLLQHYARTASTPDYWFTYHLYHKAPDWIGPQVAKTLRIPYIVAEASFAPKQQAGRWASGHKAVASILPQADLIIHLNPDDEACVAPLLNEHCKSLALSPFIDLNLVPKPDTHNHLRKRLVKQRGLDSAQPWLVCTAMMRPGDKFASYQILAQSLRALLALPWQLLVIGNGQCRLQVKALFADFDQRCHWLGQLDQNTVLETLCACDLYLWPGINEAYGLALLEAQACGLPVVTGDRPGPAAIVRHKYTGLLTPEGNIPAFIQATRTLLENPALRRQFTTRAQTGMANNHSLPQAASRLSRKIHGLPKRPSRN